VLLNRLHFGNTLDNVIVKILGFTMFATGPEEWGPGTISQEVYDMTLVRRTSSLGELVSLRQAMDRLFEDSFVRPPTQTVRAGS
jgi:hypothetical protein